MKPAALRQRVRSFPRDRLLRAITAQAAQDVSVTRDMALDHPQAKLAQVRQGMLFAVAGICVTSGTNHRSKPVRPSDVQDLVDGFHNLWQPVLDGQIDDAVWRTVLSRIAYVQFPFQLSPMASLARSLCLYGTDPRFGDAVFDEDEMRDMLGTTLPRFLYLGFAMFSFAISRGGRIPRSELLSDSYAPIFAPDSAQHGLDVIDRWLAAPADELACMGRQMTADPGDLWGFNPLFERPIIAIGDEYVVPCPAAILQRLSPQGLLFVVRDALRADADPNKAFNAFTKRLGARFEDYAGEQLGLLELATVTPEISYGGGKLSVDYIVETPQVVVLVEAKAIAPTLDTRAGKFSEDSDVARKLQKACDQIAKTAELLEKGHERFPSLNGRPMRGLVVTRDPYYWLGAPFFDDLVQPKSIPTAFVSAHELEVMLPPLMHDTACGARLLDALPNELRSVSSRLTELAQGENPLLFEVWDADYEPILADIRDAA
ncbi:hypothetical protein [Candidatus Poriferisodalis sp.]|uniref:hypothetical protein n=1 Tax=Candidatus Poriferisodalis sp. TaxID=3101277 RepID=UPI003D0DF091